MLIETGGLTPQSHLDPSISHQVYCGLDSALTLEVKEEISRQFNQPPDIYAWERELQGPYLDIMLRGFKVNLIARDNAVRSLEEEIRHRQSVLNTLSQAVMDRPLNPRSRNDLQNLFYTVMRLPEIWTSKKGVRKLSLDREALEKLEQYFYARPFVSLILSIRDLSKQLEVLQTSIDSDGRYRTSYNIAGTETGRPSSSENAFGTGGNHQNVAPKLRYIFEADRGWKLCVIDLEQVEARDEGFFCGCLFDDWSFLDAAESGDLHTANARLVWRELPWTGDLRQDRKIAERNFYREFSYRDMAKRGGHLTDYMGTAWTMARALKIPIELAQDFQARFCRGAPAKRNKHGDEIAEAIAPAFPCIPRYWRWVAEQLQTTGYLVTPFGRRRHFFGRPDDDATLREAIAFLPQSTTADRMNLGLWRVWRRMPQVELLAQTYDSITFQFREGDEQRVVQEALEHIRVELVSPQGRSYVVPGEAKTGWNWGNASQMNPEGLRKWSLQESDSRQRVVGLERRMF